VKHCDGVKPLAQFPRAPRGRTGRHTYRPPCHVARGRATPERLGGSRTYHAAPAGHVEHDHSTGAVRALLCSGCSGGLGQFEDDPADLRAAAEHVEEHRRRQQRPRPLSRPRHAVVARVEPVTPPWSPPVGSGRRPSYRVPASCGRGRRRLAEILAEREADT
jgi:hypothetical protein